MSIEALRETIAGLGASANALAALGIAIEARFTGAPLPESIQAHVEEVLAALGVRDGVHAANPPELKPLLAEIRAFSLMNAKLLFGGARAPGWAHTDPDVLQSIGDMSGAFAHQMKKGIVPKLAGLAERFDAGGAFLDVGVGVASLSIELARLFPALKIVGIDIWKPSLALARENVKAAGLADRIELREQPAQELPERDAFDLAWLPGAFVAEAVIPALVGRVLGTLRPGGWILFATVKPGSDPLTSALARLRTALWGGSLLEQKPMEALLTGAGFVDVQTLPGPPNAVAAMIAARRPAGTAR